MQAPWLSKHGGDSWFEVRRDDRAIWVFLASFVAIWTSFQIVSYASIGLHPDLLEAFTWSQSLAAGYKHPPLVALVVAAWFSVFPIAEWSFHLLAMVNAAIAFFAVDLIARRYLDGDKRLLVLLLLLLTPFYQFHGQRFSTNQILLSTWPIATYCFLRSFERPASCWSICAGAAAALAMLGKYYSIVLVAAFVIAVLAHPRRSDYLRSPAPWISVIVGLLVLSPHLYWLLTQGPRTFEYAFAVHGGDSMGDVVWRCVQYVFGAVGYVGVPIAAYLFVLRPDRRAVLALLWPADPDRRMLVILLAAPLLLPIPLSLLLGIGLTALWTMPAWFLLPIILLAPQDVTVSRSQAHSVAFAVLCFSLVVLIASPAVAWGRFLQEGVRTNRAHFAAVSQALTLQWHHTMQRPLTIVAGDVDLAIAAAFYSSDRPQVWSIRTPQSTPWITEERRWREGWAAVCVATDERCLAEVEEAVAGTDGVFRIEYEHSASFLWTIGPPVRFILLLVSPSA